MQHGGREGGEYLADAWDLQALLEEAESTNKDLVGALLDYEKLFDRFEPRLVKGLLLAAGMPEGIANQMMYLYFIDTYNFRQ